VKKSGRFTRITSSKRNSLHIIKENQPGIKRFFPCTLIGADEENPAARLTPWASAPLNCRPSGGARITFGGFSIF